MGSSLVRNRVWRGASLAGIESGEEIDPLII
jgi:hypothetical protein